MGSNVSFTPKPSSEKGYKRAQPLLGTIVRVQLHESESFVTESAVSKAFAEAERLQQIFSKFDSASELHAFAANPDHRPSAEFRELLNLSLEMRAISSGAFEPYVDEVQRQLDLSGIAKGYVVDHMAKIISHELPDAAGEINAGGDLKFLGSAPYLTHIRMGGGPHPTLLRKLNSFLPAIASSSLSEGMENPNSSTSYTAKLRMPLSPWHTITVLSESCAVADALTKVGLFGEKVWLQSIAKRWHSQILIFSPVGELQEHYG